METSASVGLHIAVSSGPAFSKAGPVAALTHRRLAYAHWIYAEYAWPLDVRFIIFDTTRSQFRDSC